MFQPVLVAPAGLRRAVPAATGSASRAVPFVLLGGLPGAGKSTALAELAGELGGVTVLDSETRRDAVSRRLPVGTAYRRYRPLVHALHQAEILWQVLRGPGHRQGLLVHDPSTRATRRTMLARLARVRGWQARLVFIDVDPGVALRGQHDRGRVVSASSFARHTRRWQVQRESITRETPWCSVDLVSRANTPDCLRARLGR